MTRKKLIVAVVAIVALAAGWYFGSPRWTLYQMAKAAEARDSDKLAAYIDFPTLRDSTKSQIKAQMAVKVSEAEGEGGFAALGAMMGMAMIDPMIDGFLTPEAMRAMFAKQPDPAAEKARPFGVDATNSRIVQEGLDQFRLREPGAKDEGGDLIFKRDGLGWRLSEIRIPADIMQDKE
jgi:hypothetical protein